MSLTDLEGRMEGLTGKLNAKRRKFTATQRRKSAIRRRRSITLLPDARARREYQRAGRPTIKATVSPETITRLTDEACRDDRFEGMSQGEVSEWVTRIIDKLLEARPWWSGHLDVDRPRKPCTETQRLALEKARLARKSLSDWREIEA